MSDYDDNWEIIPGVEPSPNDSQTFDPVKSMWLHPRQTVRRIVVWNPDFRVFLLTGLAGISVSLEDYSSGNLGDGMGLTVILGLAVLLGTLGGWIQLWIESHLLHFSGRRMGGEAPYSHIRTAVAWAGLPRVAGLGFWLLLVILLGSEVFTTATPRIDGSSWIKVTSLLITFILMGLNIWNLVLLCAALAEVQKFRSAWKGLGNILLAAAVIMVPLFLVFLFITIISLVF